jgi:hypothetical protein
MSSQRGSERSAYRFVLSRLARVLFGRAIQRENKAIFARYPLLAAFRGAGSDWNHP